MVQELSRLGDYSVEAKAIRETLELVRDLGVSYHYPLPVTPPFTEGWSLAPRGVRSQCTHMLTAGRELRNSG